MFPIDPTPFVVVEFIVVCLGVWLIYGYYWIKLHRIFRKEGLYEYNMLDIEITFVKKRDVLFENNHEALWYWLKVKRWLVICIMTWILNFSLIAVTIHIMDDNNLLINHKKGIYGRNENYEPDKNTWHGN